MECFSGLKGNTFESVLMRWMNLQLIMQTDVSQKEKNKYHILTPYYVESRKMILIVLFEGTKGDKDIKNKYLVTVGEVEDRMT